MTSPPLYLETLESHEFFNTPVKNRELQLISNPSATNSNTYWNNSFNKSKQTMASSQLFHQNINKKFSELEVHDLEANPSLVSLAPTISKEDIYEFLESKSLLLFLIGQHKNNEEIKKTKNKQVHSIREEVLFLQERVGKIKNQINKKTSLVRIKRQKYQQHKKKRQWQNKQELNEMKLEILKIKKMLSEVKYFKRHKDSRPNKYKSKNHSIHNPQERKKIYVPIPISPFFYPNQPKPMENKNLGHRRQSSESSHNQYKRQNINEKKVDIMKILSQKLNEQNMEHLIQSNSRNLNSHRNASEKNLFKADIPERTGVRESIKSNISHFPQMLPSSHHNMHLSLQPQKNLMDAIKLAINKKMSMGEVNLQPSEENHMIRESEIDQKKLDYFNAVDDDRIAQKLDQKDDLRTSEVNKTAMSKTSRKNKNQKRNKWQQDEDDFEIVQMLENSRREQKSIDIKANLIIQKQRSEIGAKLIDSNLGEEEKMFQKGNVALQKSLDSIVSQELNNTPSPKYASRKSIEKDQSSSLKSLGDKSIVKQSQKNYGGRNIEKLIGSNLEDESNIVFDFEKSNEKEKKSQKSFVDIKFDASANNINSQSDDESESKRKSVKSSNKILLDDKKSLNQTSVLIYLNNSKISSGTPKSEEENEFQKKDDGKLLNQFEHIPEDPELYLTPQTPVDLSNNNRNQKSTKINPLLQIESISNYENTPRSQEKEEKMQKSEDQSNKSIPLKKPPSLIENQEDDGLIDSIKLSTESRISKQFNNKLGSKINKLSSISQRLSQASVDDEDDIIGGINLMAESRISRQKGSSIRDSIPDSKDIYDHTTNKIQYSSEVRGSAQEKNSQDADMDDMNLQLRKSTMSIMVKKGKGSAIKKSTLNRQSPPKTLSASLMAATVALVEVSEQEEYQHLNAQYQSLDMK